MRRGGASFWLVLFGAAVIPCASAQEPARPAAVSVHATPAAAVPPSAGTPPQVPQITGAVPSEQPIEFVPVEERLGLTPRFEVRGRIEVDAIMAAQSPQSLATLGNLQNGYGFRRVRLGAQGTIADSARWVSEVELAGGNVRLRDVFVGLTALPGLRELHLGYFREPFSLEGMTSSNFITFLERSPVNDLDPARNWGICGFWWPDDERQLFSLGVFRDGTGSNGQSLGDGDNWALTTRATRLPVYQPDATDFRLVHLGAAFSHRIPADGLVEFNPTSSSNLLTVSDRPATPFLPPTIIPANSQQLYNLEAARVAGPLTLQGEWYATAIQQTNAGVVFLHGFYVDASYFLTGEHRGYNRTRGAFDRVAVLRPLLRTHHGGASGCGAFEVAARFSFADFSSANLPVSADGSSLASLLYQFTLGMNWYLNDYTRVMFNYTAGISDVAGKPTVCAHLFGIRTAIFW